MPNSPTWCCSTCTCPIGDVLVQCAHHFEAADVGQVHVALLTADTLSMDIVKAMSLGAYEYWLKPINMNTFDAALRRALSRNRDEDKR